MSELDEDEGGGGGGSPPWMSTFADLSTLLLTFFVLLLSFSTMDIGKYKELLDSVHTAFGSKQIHEGTIRDLTTSLVKLSEQESSPTIKVRELDLRARKGALQTQMLSRLRGFISDKNLKKSVQVEASQGAIRIRTAGEALFDPGSTELRPEGLVLLREIADLVRSFPYQLAIEGHADGAPRAGATAGDHGNGGRLQDNWELSTLRALSVLRFLVEGHRIDARRLSVAGFGDTRPVASNDTESGRAQNRRVEFVFHDNAVPRQEDGALAEEGAPADEELAGDDA